MKRTWPVVAVAVLLVTPLVVAGIWLRLNDRWAPIFDMALTEMRVRDVGTAHTPLLGLPGRLGKPEIGCHPGPLSFYLLSPVYRLLGGSYWALRVSTMTLNALAIISALVIARRRAGVWAVIATGLGIVFLELGFGLLVLTEPWNPHLPIFWFVPFLLALWCVVSGDVRMLPVVLGIGCFCAQTHIPYAPVCGALGLLAFVSVAVRAVRLRQRGLSPREPVRACLVALAVVLVLFAPPLIQEFVHHPGNMTILARYFLHPPDASVGLASAAKVLLEHLDTWHLVVGSVRQPHDLAALYPVRAPALARGVVVLVLWIAAAAVSLFLRVGWLRSLHAVVAAALSVVWIATSRIIGAPWHYLVFNEWTLNALVFVATISTTGVLLGRLMPVHVQPRATWVRLFGIVVIGACALRLTAQTSEVGSSTPGPSAQLAALAPGTAAAIFEGAGAATGRRGRYLVTWWDATNGVAEGIGLVNELERRGLRAGVPPVLDRLMTEHRVLESDAATARIHLATGGSISSATREHGAVLLEYSDLRTQQMQEEFAALRHGLIDELRRLGRKDIVARLDRDLNVGVVPGLNPYMQTAVARMVELGVPAAVFVLPAR